MLDSSKLILVFNDVTEVVLSFWTIIEFNDSMLVSSVFSLVLIDCICEVFVVISDDSLFVELNEISVFIRVVK
jgi:hypothetical protein